MEGEKSGRHLCVCVEGRRRGGMFLEVREEEDVCV